MQPIYFTIATYLLILFAAYLIVYRFKNQREYWYALIGCALTFPLEWFAINYPNLMVYDIRYFMIFDRLPLWMIAAYGWFFGFPLMICIRYREKINSWALWRRITILFFIFVLWDFGVEYSSTLVGYWVYYYPKNHMIGGVLPWTIPLMVSTHNTLLYYVHNYALNFSRGKGWIQGLAVHLFAYYMVIGGNMLWHAVFVRLVLGIDPTIDLATAP